MRCRVLQEWDGTVTEIGDDEFTAELRDLTDPTNCREEATFEFSTVSPDDRALLTLGAVFRWRIGYETATTGQRRRISQLRFIRTPTWDAPAVQSVERRGPACRLGFPWPMTARSAAADAAQHSSEISYKE